MDNDNDGVDDRFDNFDPCGAPEFDPATDRALIVWLDCDERIHVVGAGGNQGTSYAGVIQTSTPISGLSLNSLEASDSVVIGPSDELNFDITMGGSFTDSFSFDLGTDAIACVSVTDQSTGSSVLAGLTRTEMTGPFNPRTLEACTIDSGSSFECGVPSIDPATDSGLYLYKECNGPWSLSAHWYRQMEVPSQQRD